MMHLRYLVLGAFVAAGIASLWPASAADAEVFNPKISASVSECRVCHSWDGNRDNAEQPLRGYLALVPGIAPKNSSDKFILLNESLTWDHHDPHTLAFSVLKNADEKSVAFLMNKNLKNNKNMNPAYSNTWEDKRCLTCHSTDLDPKHDSPKMVSERFVAGENGVSCAACHGAQREWQYQHYSTGLGDPSIVAWRNITPELKEKNYGQRNLRDPHAKAQLCASCHVGNAAEGKVVTHDMYAAGHPPLPPLELLTYMKDEPMHWKTPFEQDYFKGLTPERLESHFGCRKAEGQAGYLARHVALGFLQALLNEVEVMAADAATRGAGNPIDFARFDCYACHHDLKLPSDRQERGYGNNAPGRPPLRAWVAVTVRAVIEHLMKDKNSTAATAVAGFDPLWEKLQSAATAQPFGDPKSVIAAAEELKKWSSGAIDALRKTDAYSPESAAAFQQVLLSKINDRAVRAEPEAMMALIWANKSLGGSQDWSKAAAFLPISLRTKEQVFAADKKPVPVTAIAPGRLSLFYAYSRSKFDKEYPLPNAK